MLAAPKLDTLEETIEGGNFVGDGTSKKKNVVRLSFSMREIGCKTSDAKKVLQRRSSVIREQAALAKVREIAPAAVSDDAAPVPHAQRRPSSLTMEPCVASRPLTRERSVLERASTPSRPSLSRGSPQQSARRASLSRGSFRRASSVELAEAAALRAPGSASGRRLTASGDACGFHGGNLDLPVDRDASWRRPSTVGAAPG